MVRRNIAVCAVSLSMLAFCAERASAEMGPCAPADFDLICGSGDGAARAIVKTISPSRRLAFAWRLTNKPPGNIPEQDDPALENLIVRLDDGTALAKSHGSYWDLSTKIAKAYLMTAWSPDSRLLVKIEQRAQSASAEIFSFTEDDATTGPFNLVKVIEPALQAKMPKANTGNSTVAFSAHPATTIDDQGLLPHGRFCDAGRRDRRTALRGGSAGHALDQCDRRKGPVGYAIRRHLYFDHCSLAR